MPVYKEYQLKHIHLLIWRLDSTDDLASLQNGLSKEDQKRLQKIKNPNKRLEFFSARAALYEILGDIPQLSYSATGAPSIDKYQGVSISHNKDYAAVIVSKKHKVGLDIEAFRPQMIRLQNRFLSEQERQSLEDENDLRRLCGYWCLKESFIKLLDAPELDLREQIRIAPFAPAELVYGKAHIFRGDQSKVYPWFLKMEKDFCLSFSMD